jgi:hypothetical protein
MADQVVQNYYKRLDPPDAVILKLNLKDWKVRNFVLQQKLPPPKRFECFFSIAFVCSVVCCIVLLCHRVVCVLDRLMFFFYRRQSK